MDVSRKNDALVIEMENVRAGWAQQIIKMHNKAIDACINGYNQHRDGCADDLHPNTALQATFL